MNQARSTGEGSRILGLLSHNRYLIITSVVFFVLAASAYLFFSSAKYKVSVQLAVAADQQSTESVINELRSKDAIQKAINSLPFAVSYYRKGTFKKNEIYGDSLPIKFLPGKGSVYNSSTEIIINIINNSICKVEQNNVLTDVPLYQPVNYGSLNYMIVRGPAFKLPQSPLTITLNNPGDLTKQFSKDLEAKMLSSNTFELSLNAENTQKGMDFLNKLIAVVNIQYAKTSLPGKADINNPTLAKLNDSIVYLKAIAQKYRNQQALLPHTKEADLGVPPGKDKLALDVLAALKPYLMKPIDLFVLIPDGYDVNDKHIEKLIKDFNTTQVDKQRSLQESDNDGPDITDLNAKITSLKHELITCIMLREQQIKDARQPTGLNRAMAVIAAQLNDSLAQINALIKNKQQEYNRLLQTPDALPADQGPITIIQKSDASESTVSKLLLVYLFALLAGLLLPVLLLAVNEYMISAKRMAM